MIASSAGDLLFCAFYMYMEQLLAERFSTQLCASCPADTTLWIKIKLLGADKSCRIEQLH